MPRSRIVKPEFLVDERLAGISPIARLYILGAASLADRNGVLENRPLRIRVASMPHDPTDPGQVIAEILSSGLFSLSGDKTLLRIEPWEEWFHGFPNEPILEHDQPFYRGTTVEQGQASGMLTLSMGHAYIKDKDKTKDKAKRSKKTNEEKLEPFRPEIVSMVLEILPKWPSSRGGVKFKNDPVSACANIERAIDSFEGLTLDMLRVAALEYLDNLPDFPNAIENWFGPGKPGTVAPWKLAVRGVLTNEVAV